MSKDCTIAYGTGFKVYKEGTNKILYSLHCMIFNPKKAFISTDDAKNCVRLRNHYSKQKMKDEYTSIYAVCIKVGRGKNMHYEFNTSAKTAANCIFIVPKKWSREARKAIVNAEIYDKETIKSISKFIK